jgi:hypothetical protein
VSRFLKDSENLLVNKDVFSALLGLVLLVLLITAMVPAGKDIESQRARTESPHQETESSNVDAQPAYTAPVDVKCTTMAVHC